MSVAVFRSGTAPLGVQQTQNTAPVIDFACLYTHDLRRKQKRWQDGFLRYHTFNKRIMVYDDSRNFVGDAHWKAREELQDGDEITLEKGGVMVQVAECTGTTETDLTEILNTKKKNGSSEHGSSPAVPRTAMPTPRFQASGLRPITQAKHRSLNAMLGTPRGRLGKAAIPTKSPFEERHAGVENQEWVAHDRPVKRQRLQPPAGRTVARTTNPPAANAEPLRIRTAQSAGRRREMGDDQTRLGNGEIIDLYEDQGQPEVPKFLDGYSSDALVPPSSPHERPSAKVMPAVRSSSPVFQAQKPPVGRKPRPRSEAPAETSVPGTAAGRSARTKPPSTIEDGSPSRSAERVVPSATHHLTSTLRSADTEVDSPIVPAPPSNKPGRTLKLSASAPKKKMLLCQNHVSQRPSRAPSIGTEKAVHSLLDTAPEAIAPSVTGSTTPQNRLDQRLAKIARQERRNDEPVQQQDEPMVGLPDDCAWALIPSPDANEQQVRPAQAPVTLAQLDRMMIPPPVKQLPRSPTALAEPTALSPSPPPEVPPAEAKSRKLRRVVSESNKPSHEHPKRAPGAPVRLTPTPSKRSSAVAPAHAPEYPDRLPQQPKGAPPAKSRSRKPLQRSVSLNVASNGTSTVILSKPFRTPNAPAAEPTAPPREPEPWSREAFDLFTWRPPGWDEENWCARVEV